MDTAPPRVTAMTRDEAEEEAKTMTFNQKGAIPDPSSPSATPGGEATA